MPIFQIFNFNVLQVKPVDPIRHVFSLNQNCTTLFIVRWFMIQYLSLPFSER